jgi:hypothetical protein
MFYISPKSNKTNSGNPVNGIQGLGKATGELDSGLGMTTRETGSNHLKNK